MILINANVLYRLLALSWDQVEKPIEVMNIPANHRFHRTFFIGAAKMPGERAVIRL